jgi:hypothetical protein
MTAVYVLFATSRLVDLAQAPACGRSCGSSSRLTTAALGERVPAPRPPGDVLSDHILLLQQGEPLGEQHG